MIDIKFLRENPEVVKENIRKKFQDSKLPLVDEVIELDAESRKTQQEADDLRANRNKISKEIGALMAKGLKEEAEQKKAEVAAGAKRLVELEEKEKEIIRLVANGYSNKEIAAEMYLGEGTVRNYLSSILDKLQLRDRTQVAVFYYKHR